MIEENNNKLGFIQLWFLQILKTLLSTGESSQCAYTVKSGLFQVRHRLLSS